MSKNVRSLILKSVLVVLALGLNFFAACEIGLGSSVDVESPKIDFAETTVGSGAVVRDAFAVFGTFDDDGSIGSLTAKLTNLTTGTVIEKSGKVNDSDKTWNLSFSPADEGIIDGTYDLNITIKDTADHETKISRTIIVDNTAPLVVLTRPSTKAPDSGTNFDSYGQKFTIEGKAADDNDVSLIEVNIYADASCSGTPLKTITLPNVPLTIESDVATYDKNAANDYSVIYGHVDTSGIAIRDGTTVERYCKLVVYDGAQRYPADGSAQSEEDKKGNSVDYYYLNKDLSDLFTAGYKITELYHILNGSYTAGGARSISTSGVISMLEDPSKHVTTGQFKINPENSPHFVVSARNTLQAGKTLADYPITNGNSRLEVEISPGLDGYNIKEETVGVFLVKCDLNGNPLDATGNPATVDKKFLDDPTKTTAKIIWLIETDKHAQQADFTESGSTYKFKTKLEIGSGNYTEMAVGDNYYVDVIGKDYQGNDIMSDGKYGFQLITSGLNIEVGISSSPEWLSTEDAAADANKTATVTLNYETDNNSNSPYLIQKGTTTDSLEDISGATNVTELIYHDVINITSSNHPTNLVYKVKGANSAESNAKQIVLKYDNTPPAAAITSRPDTTATQQTSITFEGTASDTQSGVKTVYVQIIDKAHPTEATPAAGETGAIRASYSGGDWLSQIRPGDYAAAGSGFYREGEKTIKVTAVDGVGLETTTPASKDFMYDKAAPSVSVTGSVPTITGKTFTLSGTASDSYKIANLKIEQKKGDGDWVDITPSDPNDPSSWSHAANQTSYNWSVTVPVKASNESNISNGEYSYKITVTDASAYSYGENAGEQNFTKQAKTADVTVSTKYYSAQPTITINQPDNSEWQTTQNRITISGEAAVSSTAVSGASISGVYYKYEGTAPTASTLPTGDLTKSSTWTTAGWTKAGEASWSIIKNIDDGPEAHNLYLVAVDNAGTVSDIITKTLKVDTSEPVLSAKYMKVDNGDLQPASGTVYVKNGTKITLYGNYKDPDSGVSELAFKFGGSPKTGTVKYSSTEISDSTTPSVPANYAAYPASTATDFNTTITGFNSWQAEFTFTSSGTISVSGSNKAGKNTSNVSILNVVYDNDPPTVRISSPSKNEKLKNEAIKISGTANDGTGSGLSSGPNDIKLYYTKSADLGDVTSAPSITSANSSANHADASSKWVELGTTASDTNWSFTQDSIDNTITPDTYDTVLYFTASAKDLAGAGNTGYAVPVKVTVDRKKPVYDTSEFRIGDNEKTHTEMTATTKPWFSKDKLVVKGKYDDGTTGSGIEEVIYKLDSNDEVTLPTTGGKFNTTIEGFTANSTLKIKAKDKAGNVTDWTTYTVQADTTPVTLTIDTYKAGSDAAKTATGTVYVKSETQIVLTGQYSNTVSGVQPLEVKLGTTPLTVKYSTNGSTFADYSATSAKTYTKWQSTFTPSASGTISVKGSNNANVEVTATSFQLTVDAVNPSLENLKLKEVTGSGENEVSKEAYYTETTSNSVTTTKYYINHTTTGKTFNLTGVATDDYGVEKVSISVVNTADSSKTITANITSPSGAWTQPITGWSDWTGGATVTITAIDKAGRTTPKTFNIVFDTTAPKAMHYADKNNKDVYFRIGNADNDKNSTGTAWETGDAVDTASTPEDNKKDSLNTDVGKKYSFGSWGNDSSIEIRGAFYEAEGGSGIKTIHYAIFDDVSKVASGTTALVAGTLREDKANHIVKVGSFSPKTEVRKNVPYTKTDGSKAGKSVKTNFRETIAGFDAQENFLVLVAEDNVGNREPDTLAVYEGSGTPGNNDWNSSNAYYGIKKDTHTPNITSSTGGLYTNGAGTDLTVSGNAGDANSGLKDVVVTIEEINFNESYSNFAKDAAHLNDTQDWSVTVPVSNFAPATVASGSSYTVYAKATDNAGSGNNKTISAATIYVDKDAPKVTISSPAANSKQGSTFAISGNARDITDDGKTGAGVDPSKDLVLYYTTSTSVGAAAPVPGSSGTIGTDAANSWVAYTVNPTLNSNGQDWSCSVNLVGKVPASANTPVFFSVSAVDKSGSGNTGYAAPVKVIIDTKAPAKTSFSITDNKKTVAEANISTTWFNSNTLNINGSFTDTDGSGVSALLYSLDGGTEKSVPTEGSVDTPIAGFTDGTHTFAVRVKDAVGNYLTLTSFTIIIDTERPEITATTGHSFTDSTLSNGTQPRTFYFDVKDTGSGIADASAFTVKAGSTTITNGEHGSSIALGTADANGKRTVTVVIGAADLATLSTGSNSVFVVAKDQADNESFSTSIGIINVDTDKPVPEFTSHGASASVNKTITLGGKVTDPSNSAIKAITLTAVCGSITKTYAYPAGTTGTNGDITFANGQWSLSLDTTEFNNTATAQNLVLSLTATDEADNVSDSNTATTASDPVSLTLSIDQNSDRPVIRFTNLDRLGAGTDSDPYIYILKYGTNARLEGKLTDDDSTSDKVVKVFKASTSPITSATVPENTGSLVSWSVSSGDFTFQPNEIGDGVKTVYFYIEDNNGGKFWTTYDVSSDSYPALSKPYQLFKTDEKTGNIATLSYKSDKTPPESTVSLSAYNAASAPATGTDTTITEKDVSLGANRDVGGTTKRWITLSTTAKDDNGIRGVVVKLEQGTITKYYRSNDKVEEEGVTAYETNTTNVAPQNDTAAGTNYTYTTDRIDLNGFAEGSVKVTVKAYDQSGLYSNQQSQFNVDNTGPAFTLSGSTKDGDIVYGIQSNTVGGSVEAIDVEKIYYAISLSDTAPTATAGDDNADYTTDDEGHQVVKNNVTGKWNLVKGAGTSATLVMYDGSTTVENAFLSQSLRSWLMALKNKTSEQLNEDDTRVNMYIHFKAVDACGNEGASVARRLSVYPNGDKPVIELVYPENKSDGTEPSLSGTIRVYGYASAAIGRVEATYLQIDPAYNGTWKTTEAANDTTDNTWRKALKTAITGTKANYPIEKIGTHNLYGIKAEGTGNWNLSINGYNEFDPGSGSGTRTIAIRIYALSESGKVSEPYTQVLKIDPNAPHIGATDDDVDESSSTALANRKYRLQIVDFTSGAGNVGDFTKISETKAYKAEMWMKGQKYLIASVYDDSGIKTITLNEKIQGVGKKVLVDDGTAKTDAVIESHVTGQDKTIRVSQVTCGYTGKKNFNICIPLPTGAGSGSLEWELEAVEDSSNNNRCKETIIINYDNTAPKLGTSGHSKYGIDADIHQSNGFYTLKGWATDADGDNNVSGMMGVAFYFMRRGSSSTRVYDPMYKDNYAAGKHNYVDVTGANPTGITYSNGLFWKHKTVAVTSSSKLESVLTVTADDNIHKGGLALIGGTIYRISDVSGTTVKVEGQVSPAETTADFALALVVDNLTKKEKTDGRTKITTSTDYGYGYYGAHDTADDGDLMVEDWDGTSVEGQWTAIINSANIPDGPIELHYVAFDKSQNYAVGIVGNVTNTVTTGTNNDYWDYSTLDVTANKAITGSVDSTNKLATNFYYAFDDDNPQPAYVSNNAPRIAGVTVGCDYNGDGSISAAEKTSKYVEKGPVVIGGVAQNKITNVAKKFIASDNGKSDGGALKVVKDKTSIELEIIGGNGNLYYQYNIDSAYKTHDQITDANFTKNNTAMTITRTANEGLNEDYNYYVTSTLPAINFTADQLTTAVGGTNGTNGVRWWTIEIWDSTEETTKFSNSQYAELKLPLDVQILDKTKPNTFINDLYWNSSTDNSVYINPADDKLEGHVELKGYLKTGTGSVAATYGNDDDKISGKVVFRGYAYDNKRLKSLKWGIKDALTGTIKQAWPQTVNGVVTVTPVSYNPETGKWGVPTTEDGVTTWTDTGDSGSSSIGLPYYYFKVYDDEDHGAYLDERGHKVYWELTIDTSHVQEPGKTVDDCWAVGKDLYVYVEATDEADKTTDMNPTVVTTGTDAQKLKPNYKVDVVPYITGIKSRLSDNRSSNGRYQIADNETGVQLEGYNLKVGSDPLTITLPGSTGDYSITLHGCETINNMNNNEAMGGITDANEVKKVRNKYNYQPSTYNDSLTDDVYIQLWQFNNRAAQTNTGVGFIREPAMAFNPTNGQIGFAFSNGANKFSMAMGKNHDNSVTQKSYQYWEMNYAKYVCNALSYDESGRSHGVSVGIDTEPSSGKAGRMNYFYSSWGVSEYGQSGNFANNTNSLHIDTIGIPNADNYTDTEATNGDWGATVIVEERFNSTSIASVNHGNNSNPTVYIAYYDDVLERIVFRWGTVTDANNPAKDNDRWGNPQNNKTSGYNNLTTTTEGSHSFPITEYSLIAGGKNVAGTTALTPYKAGEYVALDVVRGNSTANDVVCVVWYDAINDRLMYNYKTNPCNNNNADTTHTTTSGYWAEAKVLKEKCGQYCKIAVDANGGIHIAAYDSGNKGVGYVYLPKYNSAYSESNNYYLIDAMNGPFDELGIAVAVDGTSATGKAYPTISYYANGTPKMATYTTGITKPSATNPAMPAASWANGKYTGNWDVCYVPSASQLLKDHVNVVQPKNTSGVINRVSAGTGFATAGGKDNGTVTGNTTTNPILGYAIREGSKGYMEIAQRK